MAGALGAEIVGVDLSRPLDNAAASAIHAAFLDRQVLYFPDQQLDDDGLVGFGRRFGELIAHPFLPHAEGRPEVMAVHKAADAAVNVGGSWHSDMSFLDEPPLGSALHARIVPPAGGDTLFASMYAAYDALSDGMKRLLDGLDAVHDHAERFGAAARLGKTRVNEEAVEAARKTIPPATHPVVRTHPETGRKALYVNPIFTMHFAGMTRDESRPLLDFLCEHAVRPEFTCRIRWRAGGLALWDNRCTQHYAINDYHGHRRLMHRVTIAGDRPQ